MSITNTTTFNRFVGPFDHLPPFRKCIKEGCKVMILSNDVVPLCDMCGDHCATCGKVQDEYHCRQSGDIYCDDCFANRKFLPEPRDEEDSEEEDEEDSEEEDMGECPKCDCAVKRKNLAWRDGYYLDICAKCDEE
jgi:hypothetical protein